MARHYLAAVAAQIAQAAIAVLGLAVLARVLGPEDYGVIVVLGSALALLVVIIAAGLQATTVVKAAALPQERPAVHGLALVVGACSLVVVVVLAGPMAASIAGLVRPGLDPALVAVMAMRLPLMIYTGLVMTALSGAGRIADMIAVGLIGAVCGLMAPVGGVAASDGLAGAVVGSLAGSAVWAACAFAVTLRSLGLGRPTRSLMAGSFTQLALPLHLGTVAYWVMLRADVFVVNAALGSSNAGVYGLALGLSERVSVVTTPAYNVAAWRLAGRDENDALRALTIVTKLEIALGVILAVGAIVAGPLIIEVVAGPAYAAAYLPLAIMVPSAALLPVWASAGLYLVAQARGAWPTMWVQATVAGAALVGYWLLVPLAGLTGAAVVSAIAYASLCAVGLALVARHRRFPVGALIPAPGDLRSLFEAARRLGRSSVQ